MAAPERCFIGIDVAKDWLDVATHPSGETWRVPHTREAVAALVLRLLALDPALITLEASGGYEALATALLGEAGLPVAVVNPRPVRDFARSQGILAKTDRLDALVIARYGQVAEVTPQPPTAEGDRDLGLDCPPSSGGPAPRNSNAATWPAPSSCPASSGWSPS